jgi:hypothetical protein
MGKPLAGLVARFLLEIEVLPDQKEKVPEVSSQRVGGHFEYVVNTRYATQMLKYCWSLRETANELYRTTSV